MLRGRNSTMIGCKAIGHNLGASVVNGFNNRLLDCDFEYCNVAVQVSNSDRFEARGIKILNPRDTGILIEPAPDMPIPGGPTLSFTKNWFRDIDVIGNPATAAFQVLGDWNKGWLLERLNAPDATTPLLPAVLDTTVDLGDSGTATMTPDPLVGTRFRYTNTGNHMLAPSPHQGN